MIEANKAEVVLVSMVVPVYNVEPHFRRCLDSILGQSHPHMEIILVNDGSTDGSPRICEEYADLDKRISVIHKSNGGLSSARLAGFLRASGKYILFIDSDDYIDLHMVEHLLSSAETNGSQMAMCGYTVVSGEEKRGFLLPYKADLIKKSEITKKYILPLIGRIHLKGQINIPGFISIRLFRRDLIEPSFFLSEREYFTEDDLFQLLYADKLDCISIVQQPLYFYCQYQTSLSNRYRENKWQMLLNRYEFCRGYATKRGLADVAADRLSASFFSAIHGSIDNALQRSNFQAFYAEAKMILENEKSQEMLSAMKTGILSNGQKIVYYLCKFRLYRLLYLYRRMRMGR